MKNFINVQINTIETDTRVFFVGDIQGQFSLLIAQLENAKFDPTIGDILVPVGDLVDGGDENELVLSLLKRSWFKPVMGNHDHMMLAASQDLTEKSFNTINQFLIDEQGLDKTLKAFSGRANKDVVNEVKDILTTPQINWIGNKGWWFFDTSLTLGFKKRMHSVESLRQAELPLGIEVLQNGKTVGAVHAQMPFNRWSSFKNKVGQLSHPDHIFWSRENYEFYDRHKMKENMLIGDVDAVVVGHNITPNNKPLVLDNTVHIDVGAKLGVPPFVAECAEIIDMVDAENLRLENMRFA
jgi:hypothetical protein